MSELKAISGNEIREDIDYNTRGIDPENKEWCNYGKQLCDTLYYCKSEADKVIAELKQKINEVQTELELWRDGSIISEAHQKELDEKRHSDYKRCLAMAERWLFAFYVTNKCNDKFYLRSLKYRELAEQFKGVK